MSAWESFWRSVRRNRGSLILMSSTEWDDAVQRALAKLGITYEELAGMARRDDFTSVEARKLWVSIGGTPDARIAELEANLEAVRGHRDALVEMAEGVRLALISAGYFRPSEDLVADVQHMASEYVQTVAQLRLLKEQSATDRRNCVDMSDRLAAVLREKDDLERRVFELEGRAAKPTVITGEGLSTWTPR